MKTISNEDYLTVIRILKWAAVQGGCSTTDANKRRLSTKIIKKWLKK